MPLKSRRQAYSLALLPPDEIAANAIWDRAEALDATARSHDHNLWHRLRAENAPLRVVDAAGLRSAPITFFDQQLLSFAKAEWQRATRIMGDTMFEWCGQPMEPYFQAGDGLLAARIIALVELRMLERRGDPTNIWKSEVRLRDQAPTDGAGTA